VSASVQEKRSARLAAVQGLYAMEVSGASTASVQHEGRMGRLPIQSEEGEAAFAIDGDLFEALLAGAVDQQTNIDGAIAARLASGWRLERLDAVVRAILRAGVTELLRFRETPLEVVINEYVDIAHMFFDGPEPAFVNATLDAVARRRDTA
jgi:N utilization substance protein B